LVEEAGKGTDQRAFSTRPPGSARGCGRGPGRRRGHRPAWLSDDRAGSALRSGQMTGSAWTRSRVIYPAGWRS